MQRRNIPDKMTLIIYSLVFIVIIPILVTAHLAGKMTNTNVGYSAPEELNDGWSLVNPDGSTTKVTLPMVDKNVGSSAVTVTRTLTDAECSGDRYLMIDAYHAAVQLKVGDEIVYDFRTAGKVYALAPTAYHFIRLEKEYAGKAVYLTIDTKVSKYKGVIGTIYIGDRASEIKSVMQHRFFAICSYLLLLAIALIFFAIWVFVELTSRDRRDDSLLYLAMTSAFLFLGGINDTRITQFIFDDIEALCILSYEVMFMLEMSILSYFLCSSNNYIVKMTKKITFIPVLNFTVSNVLFFAGIINLEDSLIFTHVCIMLLAVCEVAFDIKVRNVERNRVGNSGIKGIKGIKDIKLGPEGYGFIFFAVMIVIDIIRYYSGYNEDHAAYIRLGVIVYILILGVESLKGRMDVMMIERQSQTYKQMALHDGLTNLSNRTAYQEKIAYLNASDTGHTKTIIAMFDLNDLKKRNDQMGHEEGDRYIKDCAYFINSFFRDFSTLFRIGGDEFAVICSLDDKKKFYNAYEDMQRRYAEADRFRINFAYGYAGFDPALDHDLYDTVRRADMAMYACKAAMKAKTAANKNAVISDGKKTEE